MGTHGHTRRDAGLILNRLIKNVKLTIADTTDDRNYQIKTGNALSK